jgi:heptosyltransferase-3
VLKPSAENLKWAENQWNQQASSAGPRVLLHPTSRVAYKCWAPQKWAEVIARLQKSFAARIMVTCSADEKEIKMAEEILKLCPERPPSILGGISLGQLAALIESAALFMGVDSAPMHIAAAVRTPVIAVFGPSNDVVWGPWGKGNRVVRRHCPCLDSKQTLCSLEKGMDCLNNVPAGEVYQAATEVLSASPQRRTREILSSRTAVSE